MNHTPRNELRPKSGKTISAAVNDREREKSTEKASRSLTMAGVACLRDRRTDPLAPVLPSHPRSISPSDRTPYKETVHTRATIRSIRRIDMIHTANLKSEMQPYGLTGGERWRVLSTQSDGSNFDDDVTPEARI